MLKHATMNRLKMEVKTLPNRVIERAIEVHDVTVPVDVMRHALQSFGLRVRVASEHEWCPTGRHAYVGCDRVRAFALCDKRPSAGTRYGLLT